MVTCASAECFRLGVNDNRLCFAAQYGRVGETIILTKAALQKDLSSGNGSMVSSSSPPSWSESHLRLAIEAAGVALWSWNVDNDQLTMDGHGYDLWGIPQSQFVCFEDLSAHIHPKDRDRVRAAFAATRAILGPFEIDFRILLGDDVRWISARGQGDDVRNYRSHHVRDLHRRDWPQTGRGRP